VQDHLTHYSANIFDQLSGEMLEEAEFRLHPERLAKLGAG